MDSRQKQTFPPEENEYMEIHWGETPLGGDLSIAYFYDKDDQLCTRENMAYMNIVIYTKDGTVVNRVMGLNPYRKSDNVEMTQNPQEIADKYAAEHGYNSAECITEKEGWVYFRLLQKSIQQAAFLPDVIKIGKTGKLQNVTDVIEKLRALNEGEKMS
jgi:hypothetical protein